MMVVVVVVVELELVVRRLVGHKVVRRDAVNINDEEPSQ